MKATPHPLNYHLGLLHLAHLLMNADGFVDQREKKVILELQQEEQIPDFVMRTYYNAVKNKTEREIFKQGIDLLNPCTEEEKLCALVHLYCLAEADNLVHVKEVRLLLYSLKATTVDFDDVVMTAMLLKARKIGYSIDGNKLFT